MALKRTGFAEMLGVSPEFFEADFKIRRPEDPDKAKRDHDKAMLILRLTGWLSGAALALALALSWLFLHYGRPEQAEKVVATVIGLIGGIGIGRTTANRD